MKLFVDNLTVIDCSYLDEKRGMVGESWICDIVLPGALDSQSMIMDFGLVKKHIKQKIDMLTDHALLVPEVSDAVKEFSNHNGQVTLSFVDASGFEIDYRSPEQAVCVLPVKTITKEAVAEFLSDKLRDIVPDTVSEIGITLRTETIDGPYYHYTHGLKKHDGNCQRIAHGHRSKIEIWKNGVLATDLMQKWAEVWRDITIITQEDIVNSVSGNGRRKITSAYRSDQGEFELTMDAARCYVLPCDSTVESIADYLVRQCKLHDPSADYMVKAYEGVGKGAMVSM